MNELKRYDQELSQQLQQLPLPAEDHAWAEMKKMLDGDDDDPILIPFYKRWGCLLVGLLAGLIIAGAGWWYFDRDKDGNATNENNDTITTQKQVERSKGEKIPADSVNKNEVPLIDNSTQGSFVSNSDTMQWSDTGKPINNSQNAVFESTTGARQKTRLIPAQISSAGDAANKPSEPSSKKRNRSVTSDAQKQRITTSSPAAESNVEADEKGNDMVKSTIDVKAQPTPSATSIPGNTSKSKDTITTNKKGEAVKKDTLPTSIAKKSENKNEEKEKINNWSVAAGLSIYQPIKLSGESSVPYNFYGRKGILTDYIPSAYLRLYRKNKWFFHSEFRYGAPQTVKPFEYKKVLLDTLPTNYTTANYRLRKTYYHQLPLSIHYFVRPKLSVGAGIIFNHFTGALADMDTYKRVGGQTDSLQSSKLVNEKKDSRFVSNHLQWSAEIQYNWKRFFIGARYSQDFTPFIKYTDINTGAAVEKKLQALNIFVRYELWKSKNKGQ